MRSFYHAVNDLVGHSDDQLVAEYRVESLLNIGTGRQLLQLTLQLDGDPWL